MSNDQIQAWWHRAHLDTTTKSARKRTAAVCGAPAAATRRGHAFWDHSATLGIRTCCGWSFGHSRGPVVVPRCAQGSRRGKKDRVTANNHKDFRSRSGETPITVRFNRLKPAAALRASLCEAWRLDIYEPQRPTGLRPKAQRCPATAGLRWVGVPTGRQPQRGCGYFRARVDHYWSFGFAHMSSNGAMGHNPVGVLETVNLRAVHCSSICFYDESFLALNKIGRASCRERV